MSDLHESMASLIECSICLETFRDPRMLTCLHKFCQKCLQDHINSSAEGGQFQCPVCRESLQAPMDGADAFPRNFFVNSYMAAVKDAGEPWKIRKTSGKKSNIDCSNFERGNDCSDARKFCKECCEYYCDLCTTAHSRFKVSRKHTVVLLSDVTEEVLMEARLKRQIPKCLKHNKDLELYCSTCKRAVCSVCCLVSHHTHTFHEIADVDKELQSGLSQVKTRLDELKTSCNNHRESITRSQETRKHNVSVAKATMKDLFKKMRKALDEKETEVDRTLSEINVERQKNAAVQENNLTLHYQQLDSLQSFADSLLTKGNVFNRLANSLEVQKRMDQFRSSSLTLTAESTNPSVPESWSLVSEVIGSGMEIKEEVQVDTAGRKIHTKQTVSVSPYEKMEFTFGPGEPKLPVAMTIPVEIIQQKLDIILVKGRASNEEVFDWIDKNVDKKRTAEDAFIRALMTSVCSSAISEAGDKYKVDSGVIKDRIPLLQRYLDHKTQHELQTLYALQALMHRLEYPPAESTNPSVPESWSLVSEVIGSGMEIKEEVQVDTAGPKIHTKQTVSVSPYEKMEFTVGPGEPKSPVAMTIPVEIIQRELDIMLVKGKALNEEIFDWIDKNVDKKRTAEDAFIRALMTSVCSSAISEAGDKYKVDSEVIKDRIPLLQRYLDRKTQHELQALYALQALMHRLEHPPVVLRTFFDTLYDEDIISEDAFNQWDQSNDAEPGKGVARSSVVQFFNWLREAEEESQDES